MKITLFYLSLPTENELFRKYCKKDVHQFLIIQDFLDLSNIVYDDDLHTVVLYAYTTNKRHADIFELSHNRDLFIRSDKDISKSEYEDLCKLTGKFSLIKNKLSSNLKVITTVNELDAIDDMSTHIEQLMVDNACDDYIQYKSIYIEALDYIMYCTINKLCSEDSEYYSYNYSYGITAEGYVNDRVSINYKKDGLYLSFLKLLLLQGDNDENL